MASQPSLNRLFVGTFLSFDQQQRLAGLKDVHDRLSNTWDMKLRWVWAAKLHVTWLFIGSVAESGMLVVKERLAKVMAEYSCLQFNYDQSEFWPSPTKARQLVLTPSVIPSSASALAKDIRRELGEFVAQNDHHGFRPHITVLRLERRANSNRGRQTNQPLELPSWFDLKACLPIAHNVESVSLIESHLGSQNDGYQTLECFLLRRLC